MSTPHLQNQSEDSINFKMIGIVAGIALIVFVLGILWSTAILKKTQGEPIATRPIPRHIGEAEIGIVDMHMFGVDRRAPELRAQKLERLSSYGWVDAEKNLVHVPIDVAMDRYIAASRKVPAPGLNTPPPAQDGAGPN